MTWRVRFRVVLGAITLISMPVNAAPTRAIDVAFDRFSARALTVMLRDSPTSATQLGDHHFDENVTSFSAAARAHRVAHAYQLLNDLAHFPQSALSADNQVDAAMLRNALNQSIWSETKLQDWAWDAQIYNDAAGASLYNLAARDFAPWPQRLHAATIRMEKIPRLFAQARANLVPARVPLIVATTVAAQNQGIVSVAESMLVPHVSTLSEGERRRFQTALATLKVATARHQQWLDTVLVPNARGDFRLGRKLYDEKLKFALNGTLDRDTIKARATQAIADTRAQMYQVARTVLEGKTKLVMPLQPSDAQQQATIEAALALTYVKRPARDAVESDARAAVATATAFVQSHHLLSLPAAPVLVIEMPKFQQGVAVAYCDAAGPLEPQLPTFYAVSPIPVQWDDAQTNSFLREYNSTMIHDLSIHEAMPGHYVQLDHANSGSSPLRAVLSSGPFVEGWAVYAEGMMADEGYQDHDPLFKLTVLKMRLRSITNSLLDIGIHAEKMTESEATLLMTHTAFQQEREAAGKWTRARLTSTQLLSYFVGYSEHMALREEAKVRWGSNYNLFRYNQAVLAHGSPATRYVRALMFDLPIK